LTWPFRRSPPESIPPRRKSHDFVIAMGLFFASIFDPKTKILTEMIDKKDINNRADPGKENA
jgi:hypothetical protein